MELALVLPGHVAAGFAGEAEAAEWLIAAATGHAKAQALAAANDQAQALLRAAAAPFDGESPTCKTLAERVEQIASNAVTLGTRLAVETAHADPGEVQRVVSEVLGGPPE